jgi:hypothetical protein
MAELSQAEIEQRRAASRTHGAHSYLARTGEQGGGAITADMGMVESAVFARHDDGGARGMVETSALRFETAAELLWRHMQTSREAFDAGLKTWGWLQGAAVRAWRDLAALPSDDDERISAAKVLESLGEHDNGK